LTIHNWHLDKILFPKIAVKRQQYMKYSRQQAVERTRMGSKGDRKDFFHYLLEARDCHTGRGFSEAELWGESNLFIIAGSDTTSTALAAAFFYLAHSPASLARATAEVRAAFPSSYPFPGTGTGTDDPPVQVRVQGGDALARCVFLRACIDEAMRLSPPVAGGLPRCVLPGGLVVDGHVVPAGIDVCVPHYAIHRNPAYFPGPHDFVPARWLPAPVSADLAASSSADLASKRADVVSAFCPFSIGPRGCIGKGLAYAELGMALARVLWEFEVRIAPGTTAGEGRADLEEGRRRAMEYQLKDTFTSVKDGPMLQFRRRVGLD
jgi:cytochrome P450